MDVVKTIRPGQPGSRRFQREWGDKLIAVRYRKGPGAKTLLTTVEVVVDEREYQPGVSRHGIEAQRRAEVVAIRIGWQEKELREKVKAAGARWSPGLKLWLLRRDTVNVLGLGQRIVEGAAVRCEDVDTSVQL